MTPTTILSRRNNLSFLVSNEDAALIGKIVDRYIAQWKWADRNTMGCVRLGLETDLTVCHANGSSLKLAELLAAPESDFLHDIRGIREHLDRTSGEFLDHFSPRYLA